MKKFSARGGWKAVGSWSYKVAARRSLSEPYNTPTLSESEGRALKK